MRRADDPGLVGGVIGCGYFMIFLFGFLASSLHAEKPRIGPTLLLHPIQADVVRGRSAEIRLEAVSASGNQVEFRISKSPAHGSLGSPVLVSGNIAMVNYQNNGDPSVTDEFEFRIKAPGRAWSTHQAVLRIKDPPNSLKVTPEVIDFGCVGIGEASQRSVVIENGMAERIEGVFMPPTPWKVMADSAFCLKLGEKLRMTLTFQPRESGKFEASVGMVPGINGSKVLLKGSAIPPFSIPPVDDSVLVPSQPLAIRVRNRMDHPIIVSCKTETPLSSVKPLHLAAGEEGKAILRRIAGAGNESTARVVFTTGDYEQIMTMSLPRVHSNSTHDEKGKTGGISKETPVSSKDDSKSQPQNISLSYHGISNSPSNRVPKEQGPHDVFEKPAPQDESVAEPTVLPEKTQSEIRQLIIKDISWIVNEGWMGWSLILKWKCDDPGISEYRVEQSLPGTKSGDNVPLELCGAFRQIKPRLSQVSKNGEWQAETSVSTEGFHTFRITPIAKGSSKSVSASFQVYVPPNKPFYERYRMVLALIVAAALAGYLYWRKRTGS